MNTDLITSKLHFLFFISMENQSTPDRVKQTHLRGMALNIYSNILVFARW